jgi:3-isopropylmalate/(R)-2-methylmalate dehydratase small subunit
MTTAREQILAHLQANPGPTSPGELGRHVEASTGTIYEALRSMVERGELVRDGLGVSLFADWRYDQAGQPKPDFVLNTPAAQGCQVLVAGRNIGCGSSREHAPWALLDFGIRCVISTSFADIFYNNCFKNGILPITVSQEDLDKLFDDADRGSNATLTVDLEKQEIKGPDGGTITFEIDPFRKKCLMEGLDDIGLTMVKKASIDAYEAKAKENRAWL